MHQKYHVIGVMSGTSLDGVDLAYCEFNFNGQWTFRIIHAETVSYNEYWKGLLGNIHKGSAEDISVADCMYGKHLGELVKDFCRKNSIVPDFISSHGHTIFHQPQKGFTWQIGSGAYLSAVSGFQVVCDFRSGDVALGGQGAPLVPVGDKLLFEKIDFCLNLGGISNVSYDHNGKRVAFDISPCNLVLNHFSMKRGMPFDEDGKLAENGTTHAGLLDKLNKVIYYSKSFPKSLGRENIENEFLPLIESFNLKVEDVLATLCEHIAIQISAVTGNGAMERTMLVTGGGALNKFLINCMKEKCKLNIIVPDRKIVEFKEALIFAFLGVLRLRGESNCLMSVTGASRDNCSGAVYPSNNQQ
jgi:anhydro-N-acetylmuramic acid kinase